MVQKRKILPHSGLPFVTMVFEFYIECSILHGRGVINLDKKIIKMPSLKEQVYSYLREAIIVGELEEGKIYSEQWFADLLDVSRTPVREAILQLNQENLVDIIPYRGIVIKAMTEKEVKDIFEIRQAIEGYCVRRIAEEINNPLVANLLAIIRENIEEQKKLIDQQNMTVIKDFLELDFVFHQEIVNFVDNDRFSQIITDVRSRIQKISIQTLKEKGRLDTGYQEHLAIYNNMASGNSFEAYASLNEHLNCAKIIFERSK